MHALSLLIPALSLLGIAAGAGKEMTKRAGSTDQKPVWEAIDENKSITKISELQAIAKDYFEWVNTQPGADAENGACIVSSFYDPTTSRVYSSTIPRDGDFRNEMRTRGAANAPVWFAAGGSATPYHAEDACYYDYEKENKQTTGKDFFPGGKMIASHGYLTARRKSSPGPVNNPCDDPNTAKRPSCSSVARSLHVKWKDGQKYEDGECSKTWTYNELDGNMYDEHGQVVGQNVLDESTGEVYFSTNAKKRSLAGRIDLERRAGTTTVACVTEVSSSMSAGTTNTAATTSQGAAATTSANDSSSAQATTTTAAAATTSAKADKTTTSAKAKETPKSKDTKKDKKKGGK